MAAIVELPSGFWWKHSAISAAVVRPDTVARGRSGTVGARAGAATLPRTSSRSWAELLVRHAGGGRVEEVNRGQAQVDA
jgi:hypothetical protein